MAQSIGYNEETDTFWIGEGHTCRMVHSEAAKKLREILAIPGMTDEERAVVEAERVLDEALGKTVSAWQVQRDSGGYSYSICHVSIEPADWISKWFKYRDLVARAAAEYVQGLTKKRPDVERMEGRAIYAEMRDKHGFTLVCPETQWGMEWRRCQGHTSVQITQRATGEECTAFHIRALREARRLDGDE